MRATWSINEALGQHLYGFLRTDPLTGLRTLESKGRAGTLSFEDRYAIANAVVDARADPPEGPTKSERARREVAAPATKNEAPARLEPGLCRRRVSGMGA